MLAEIARSRPNEKRFCADAIGEWEWGNGQTVVFTSPKSIYEESEIPERFGSRYISIFHPNGTNCVIGVEDGGNTAWRFRADTGRIEQVAILFQRKEQDPDFYFLKGFTLGDGMALIYEGGVLYFNDNGSFRWRQDHPKLDWLFQGFTEHGIQYKDFWDKIWIYDPKNGARRIIQAGCGNTKGE
jgi:hypothetical protein